MKAELWDPFAEMKNFRKEIDRLYKDFWSNKLTIPKGMKLREPLVDIIERPKALEVRAEIPGIEKKDVTVIVEENRIELKAEKKKEKDVKKKDYHMQERTYTGFYKMMLLPAHVDPQKAKASFKQGVLTLTLPKVKELPKKVVLQLK